MTLKEYISGLNKFVKDNPTMLKMQVVTSRDDEGNGFNPIYFSPTKGVFEDGDFIDYKSEDNQDRFVNAVCVN
jgi:hypothetical protein